MEILAEQSLPKAVPSLVREPPSSRPKAAIYGHAVALTALAGFIGCFYWDYLAGTGFIWEDALRWYYPVANHFCSAMADGRFPFWMPTIQNGMPLYTDVQASFYYPLLWVLIPFAHGGELSFLAYQWYIVLHILMGGVFMYWFLVRHQLRPLASLLGAITFCFSGFMSLRVIHVPMLQVYAWLPLQLLLVEKCVAGRQARNYGLLTAVLVLACLAGFPQVMLYNSLFVVAYWFYCAYQAAARETSRAWRAIVRQLAIESLRMAGVFASVLILTAFQFLPSMEHWAMSQREKWDYSRITDHSLPWHLLIHFLVPNFFGVINYAYSMHVLINAVPFWAYDMSVRDAAFYGFAPWQYIEFSAYAGQLAVVALAGLALNWKQMRRNVAMFFVMGWLVALWFMLGRYGGLFSVLYHIVPGVSLFRGPARMSCVVDFCAAVMVAMFVASWTSQSAAQRRKPLLVVLGLYVVGICCFFAWGQRLFPQLQNLVCARFAVKETLLCMALFAGIAVCLWGLQRWRKQWQRFMCSTGLAALVFTDLHHAYAHFHEGWSNPIGYFNLNFDALRYVKQTIDQMTKGSGPVRFAQMVDGRERAEFLWDQNAAFIHEDLEIPGGYTTFILRHIQMFQRIQNMETQLDLQNVRLIADLNTTTHQAELKPRYTWLPRALFYDDIKAYPSDEAILHDLNAGVLNYHHTLAVLASDYGNAVQRHVFNPLHEPARVALTRISPECIRIHYTVSRPGVIFVSQSFYPGWEAVDRVGKSHQILRAFIAFTGVVIPTAGTGEVTLRFRPMSFRIGVAVSVAAALALVVFYSFLHRRERRALRDI